MKRRTAALVLVAAIALPVASTATREVPADNSGKIVRDHAEPTAIPAPGRIHSPHRKEITMRIEEHGRSGHDFHLNHESGCLDRVRAQYESLSRPAAVATVETPPRGDFVEVSCRLAPAIRRRRLVS